MAASDDPLVDDPLVTGLAALAAVDSTGDALRSRLAGARLDSLVALALRRSPQLLARTMAIETAREEISAAGALPDPMVALSARGDGYPGAGLGEDPMAMAALEFTQTIPWPGKRTRREAVAAARVPELAVARDAARREVAAQVREAWAEIYATDRALTAWRQTLALLDVLEPRALRRYETGPGAQTDWLALRRERAALSSDLDRGLAARTAVLARLAATLDDTAVAAGVNADALPDLTAPEPETVDGAAFADVAMAQAALETAHRKRESAQVEGRPDLIVGAEYGWRGAMTPMISARMGVELPLWRGRKQDALARAAGQSEAGARADARQARLEADALAVALAARHQAAARAAHRLRAQILPLLELTAESARVRYLSGDARADLLLETLRGMAAARGELAREEAAAYAAGSRLRALTGRDPVAGDGREP